MSTIHINTITPVHIGSGNELQGEFEYLYFKKEGKIAVIDSEKVLGILGEENLPQWVACIENGDSLLSLLQNRRNDLSAADVGTRLIATKKGTSKPIKEQLRSGNGTYLLPGTSLKGAIRTAAFGSLVIANANLAKEKNNLGTTDRQGRFRWSDSVLSKTFFGSDPNHDIFRLLQVGDAAFDATEVQETVVLNEYRNRNESNWRIKNELTQFIEAIPAQASTTLQIKYNDLLHQRAGKYFNRNASRLELPQLFATVNQHTRKLVQDEIGYWTESAHNPTDLGDYVTVMQDMRDAIDACGEQECILRVGWGSGFRFMTGDWHGAMTDEDYGNLVQSLRPKHPEDFIFPKTIRYIADGTPLGFVKLTIS